MSIETQTLQPTAEIKRTVTEVGKEAYASLSDVIKKALLENDVTGERESELRYRDDALGIDIHVHGNTSVSDSTVVPAILLDNLRTDDSDSFKSLAIQADGSQLIDGRAIYTVQEAEEKAAFAQFVVTLPRVSYE